MSRYHLRVVFLAVVLAGLPAAGLAQSSQGAVAGTVSDPSGAVAPRAQVTATNLNTGLARSVLTNETGGYVIQPLPVGSYRVASSLSGFREFEQSPVVVSTATTTNLNITLLPGVVSEKVTVIGTPPPLQTANAEMSTVVEGRVVKDLPLQLAGNLTGASGRRQVDNFIFLTPGVVGTQWAKYFNGTTTFAAEAVIDGISAQNPIVPGTLGNFGPPFEAVEEFNVQSTGFSAEYSRGFGVMNFNMKSGTNQLHGSAFEFLRNDHMDARGFFQNTRPLVRQNEFGFTVGGPVLIPRVYNGKNRTFFYGSFSGFRLRGGSPDRGLTTLPTAQMKQGDLSQLLDNNVLIFDPATTKPDGRGNFEREPFPGNGIPSNRISPVAARLLPFIPDPDFNRTFNNYVSRTASPTDDNTWSLKLDHSFSDSEKLSFTYWWDDRRSPVYTPIEGELGAAYAQVQKGGGVRLSLDSVLRPNLLNHFGVGYNRRQADRAPLAQMVGNDILQIPNLPSLQGWPQFAISGYQTMGWLANYPYREKGHNYILVDSVTWIRGKHQWKAGLDVRWMQYNYFAEANAGGTLSFSNPLTSQPNSPNFGRWGDGFASFLLGYVDSASRLVGANSRGFRFPYYSGFVQDEYRITARLSLTMGLRIERPYPMSEQYDRLSGLSLSTPNPGAGGRPGALIFAGTGPGRSGLERFAEPRTAWAPRAGIAYSFDSRTVLRVGYGIFNAMSNGNVADGVLLDNVITGFAFPQSVATLDNGLTPAFQLAQGFPAVNRSIPSFDPTLANGVNIDYYNQDGGKSAYTQSWNVSIQRQLPWGILLDTAYVGNKGTNLAGRLENLNQVDPRYLSLGATLNAPITSPQAAAAAIAAPYPGFAGSVAQALRPFPQYLSVNSFAQPTGSSTYHALQMKTLKRFSSGLSFLVSYTLSKNIANTNLSGWSGTAPQPLDTYNRGLEKSLTAIDSPHNLVTSFVYELPFGPGRPFASRGGTAGKLVGGWQISGSTRYTSGTPISVGGGPSLPLFGGANRPNQVPGAAIRTSASPGDFDPARDRYLSISAFTQPAPFTIGTLGPRLPNVRGFSFWNEDLAVIKRTQLFERHALEFRLEMFNAFNRVVFANPSSSINSPQSFGTVGGQANVPRVMQLALKYLF